MEAHYGITFFLKERSKELRWFGESLTHGTGSLFCLEKADRTQIKRTWK
jgi:hypothetical protein